jgi:uncharacterized protein
MAERRITISKLDHQGRPLFTYPGDVLFDDGNVLVARCVFAPQDTTRAGLTFSRGDILIECYYRQEPFNIFAVYAPTGSLKGWYCNVLEHTEFTDGSIGWADLALDLLVMPDGESIVLDGDEFEAIAPSAAQRERARAAVETLERWVLERAFPFNLPH